MKGFLKYIPILLLLCGLCGFSTIYADQTYTFYRVNTSCIIDSSGNRVNANDVIQKDAAYSLQTRTILEWKTFSDSLSGCVGKWNYAEKVNLTLKDADEVYLAGYGSDWYNSAIPKKDGYEFKGWIDSKGNNIGNTFHIYNTDTTTSYEYTASWETEVIEVIKNFGNTYHKAGGVEFAASDEFDLGNSYRISYANINTDGNNHKTVTYILYGSNDKSNWTQLGTTTQYVPNGTYNFNINVSNTNAFRYVKIYQNKSQWRRSSDGNEVCSIEPFKVAYLSNRVGGTK